MKEQVYNSVFHSWIMGDPSSCENRDGFALVEGEVIDRWFLSDGDLFLNAWITTVLPLLYSDHEKESEESYPKMIEMYLSWIGNLQYLPILDLVKKIR